MRMTAPPLDVIGSRRHAIDQSQQMLLDSEPTIKFGRLAQASPRFLSIGALVVAWRPNDTVIPSILYIASNLLQSPVGSHLVYNTPHGGNEALDSLSGIA